VNRIARVMTQHPPCLRDDILCEEANGEEPRLLIDKLIVTGDTRIRKTKRPTTLTWASGLAPFTRLRTIIAYMATPTILTQPGITLVLEASVAEGVKGRDR
jgi:hypothetical protein